MKPFSDSFGSKAARMRASVPVAKRADVVSSGSFTCLRPMRDFVSEARAAVNLASKMVASKRN